MAAASDDSLDGLVVPIEPIAPDALCIVAHDLFLQDPRLHAIPVVDARSRPVGLLNRFRVLEGFSQRFGHELWARRRVHDVMERHPLIVDHNTTLDDLSTMIAEDDSQATTEDLGTQTMEGLQVTGVRTTRTIPAGEIGNEKPIVIVTEVWTSPDLKTVVYSKRSDPRMGEQIFKLTNITRAEPDASLFIVPADFRVTDGPQNFIYKMHQ